MPESIPVGGHQAGFLATERKDGWWAGPMATAIGLGLFALYATWAAFQGQHYYAVSYLSPFYSPVVYVDPAALGSAPLEHAWFGTWPAWWSNFPLTSWLPASPAFLILLFPGSFRLTCYYYRKAYYRAFMGTPPGCGVGPAPLGKYSGETTLFLFQNLHRFAMYFAVIFIGLLYYDAFQSFFYHHQFGVGVGSIVLTLNATFLASYTFGCHSFRHLIGGKMDCFSCPVAGEHKPDASPRYGIWKWVTFLNERHMQCAWISLFWVGFSDVYVRLVSMGIIHDINTWGVTH